MTDDSGTDDFEFVELLNAGISPVDISGWTLGGADNVGANLSAVVPGALLSGTTILAPGGYYVFGNTAVTVRNQLIAANFIENDAEQIHLWAGAVGSTLVDGFITEGNKGAGAAATQYGTPSAAMLAQVGTVYRGNFQTGHINGQGSQGSGSGPVLVSLSRYSSGLDSNNNGRDFGVRWALKPPGCLPLLSTHASSTPRRFPRTILRRSAPRLKVAMPSPSGTPNSVGRAAGLTR